MLLLLLDELLNQRYTFVEATRPVDDKLEIEG